VAWARLLLVAALLAGAGPAAGHALRVFAAADGPDLQGYAYHPGAGGAADVRVRAEDGAGEALATARTDPEGRFRLAGVSDRAVRVVAQAADGHRAEWRLSPLAAGRGADPPGTAGLSAAEVEALVARQLAPLREDLQRLADRRRLQDILGGLGYLLGLAGLGAWLHARRRR
jgi:nickel transport protein